MSRLRRWLFQSSWTPRRWLLVSCVSFIALHGVGLFGEPFADEAVMIEMLEAGVAPWDLFHFLDPERPHRSLGYERLGFHQARIIFVRPLPSLFLSAFFTLAPQSYWLWNAVGMAFGVLTLAGAHAVYRQSLPPPWQGPTTLIAALALGPTLAVASPCNHSHVMAACFGFAALARYLQWQNTQRRRHAVWMTLFLLMAAACGEYAWTLIGAFVGSQWPKLRRRQLPSSLCLVAVVFVAQLGVSRLVGGGTENIALYLDPLAEPAVFLQGFPRNFLGLWSAAVPNPLGLTLGTDSLWLVAAMGVFGLGATLVMVVVFRQQTDVSQKEIAAAWVLASLLSLLPLTTLQADWRVLTVPSFLVAPWCTALLAWGFAGPCPLFRPVGHYVAFCTLIAAPLHVLFAHAGLEIMRDQRAIWTQSASFAPHGRTLFFNPPKLLLLWCAALKTERNHHCQAMFPLAQSVEVTSVRGETVVFSVATTHAPVQEGVYLDYTIETVTEKSPGQYTATVRFDAALTKANNFIAQRAGVLHFLDNPFN